MLPWNQLLALTRFVLVRIGGLGGTRKILFIDLADSLPDHPNMWTDGSRDEDLDAMVGVAGAGAFVKNVPWVFDDRAWGHAQDLDLNEDAARIFSMVLVPLQTV